MADPYSSLRSLSFAALASAIGIDLQRFKHHKDEWHGYCPVHKSQKNNNCFHYNDSTGAFHCFSCHAKGKGIIDLTMAIRGGTFTDAVNFLQVVKPLPQQEKPRIEAPGASGEALKPFTGKYHKFPEPSPWLENRCPNKDIRERYGVFQYFNPARKSEYSHKVLIPVKNIDGVLYGYLARNPEPKEGDWKYKFPTGLPKSQFLFGAHELWEGRPHRIVYLVESPFACLKFASLGFPAVAAYGWSVSEAQISLLRTICKGLIYLPDRNKSVEAASQLADIAHTLWVRFPPLPDGIDDPEQLQTREQILAL